MTPTERVFYDRIVEEDEYHIADLTACRGAMPDFLLRKKRSSARAFGVEVKWKNHDTVTREQKRRHQELRQFGLRVEIVYVSGGEVAAWNAEMNARIDALFSPAFRSLMAAA